MKAIAPRLLRTGLIGLLIAAAAGEAYAADPRVERGKYLVAIGGCGDCHTPGSFLGHPDMTRILGGSDVGFGLPTGVYVGPNLTPDKTGLGEWTEQQIVTAITTGKRPDGRILAPIMPWRELAHLTPQDAKAIAAYLKSLPAVSHKVPPPLGPGEKPETLVMTIIPADVYTTLLKP